MAMSCTHPGLLWDDSLCNDFEVMHVEHVLERRTSSPSGLSSLFFFRNLLDHLCDRASIDDTKAELKIQGISRSHLCVSRYVLLLNGQVGGNGIWWVDGLIGLADE